MLFIGISLATRSDFSVVVQDRIDSLMWDLLEAITVTVSKHCLSFGQWQKESVPVLICLD